MALPRLCYRYQIGMSGSIKPSKPRQKKVCLGLIGAEPICEHSIGLGREKLNVPI